MSRSLVGALAREVQGILGIPFKTQTCLLTLKSKSGTNMVYQWVHYGLLNILYP